MRKHILVLIILFWTIITAGVIIYNENLIRNGKEILLKVVPYDPRDFLRGDYIILNYEISTVDEKILPVRDYKRRKVYVVLEQDSSGDYKIKELVFQKPAEGIFLKGELYGRQISYNGINQYFIKEGTGKELEKKLAKGAYARISVNSNGTAVIKDIIMNKQ